MMCDNLSALYPNAHLDFAGMHLDSYYSCAIISTLVILPTVWLRDLSLLSYISGKPFSSYVKKNICKSLSYVIKPWWLIRGICIQLEEF